MNTSTAHHRPTNSNRPAPIITNTLGTRPVRLSQHITYTSTRHNIARQSIHTHQTQRRSHTKRITPHSIITNDRHRLIPNRQLRRQHNPHRLPRLSRRPRRTHRRTRRPYMRFKRHNTNHIHRLIMNILTRLSRMTLQCPTPLNRFEVRPHSRRTTITSITRILLTRPTTTLRHQRRFSHRSPINRQHVAIVPRRHRRRMTLNLLIRHHTKPLFTLTRRLTPRVNQYQPNRSINRNPFVPHFTQTYGPAKPVTPPSQHDNCSAIALFTELHN